MENGKRIEWIDFVRSLAIVFVILCHSTEGIYILNMNCISSLSFLSKLFAFSSFTAGRLGVPLFLMISGYLLLDKKYSSAETMKFWNINLLHLFICTEIWFTLYEIFLIIYSKHELGIIQIVEDLLFIHRVNMSHVWYMPMILGMYILIPFVANALNSVTPVTIKFPVLFFSFFTFGYTLLKIFCNVLGKSPLTLQMSLGFSGGTYGIYIIAGYLIKKGQLKNIKPHTLLICIILNYLAAVGIQLWAYNHNYQYNIWYDCPFLFGSSIAIMELCSRIQTIPMYNWVRKAARFSFAVYLIHNLCITILKNSFLAIDCMLPTKVILLWIIVTVFSFLCAWIISMIPKVGKYILYIK